MPRSGQAGQLYPNRQDLTRPLPVTTAPGQGYGVAAQQAAAQQAVPMGQPQGPPQGPQTQAQTPGGAIALRRPTERPDEPLTAGMPQGAGPGPEALTGVGQVAQNGNLDQDNLASLLSHLASQPGASVAVRDLAQRAMGGVQ